MSVAAIYNTIYIFAVFIITCVCLSNYKGQCRLHKANNSEIRFALFLLLVLVLFIGTRPWDGRFFDTKVYYLRLTMNYDPYFTFNWDAVNLVWDNLIGYWGKYQFGATPFFILVAAIYFCAAFYACKRMFPNDVLISFLVFLAAFSTFSYATNGIKAGIASSIFLLAIAYKGNKVILIPLLFLSWGCHHSMSFPILTFVVTQIYNKPKYYFLFWIFCFIMAAAHVTTFQYIFADYTDEKGAQYLMTEDDEWAGKGGFRIDFILYSAMPILLGWYSTTKKKIQSDVYNTLLCLYLLNNSIWMLCMYVNYNNRIAYLSWFLYPFVLIYPILNESWTRDRYSFFRKVVYLHLFFTMFMVLIYYR